MKMVSSSLDKDAAYGKRPPKIATSPAGSASHSQPSVAEISLAHTESKEVLSSFDDSVNTRNVAAKNDDDAKRNDRARARAAGLARSANARSRSWEDDDVSSASSDDGSGIWGERRRDDPVGAAVARRLNEGGVPCFGYPPAGRAAPLPQAEGGGFGLCPLFTARNYRAARSFLRGVWKGDRRAPVRGEQEDANGPTHSMRFLVESFAACYVVVYSLNDVVLRLLAEIASFLVYVLFSFILFDLEEVKHALMLLRSVTPAFFIRTIKRLNCVDREMFGIVEREFLWGKHFQGRTFLWSNDERLIKFRRKHRRLMATKIHLRHKRREVWKARDERRKREKRGEPFTPKEIEKMERDNDARAQLEADERQFSLKPPTFFPEKVVGEVGPDLQLRGDATNRHMESLQYCHGMIFLRDHGRDWSKPVLIKATRNSKVANSSTFSPKESIEVVDQFPDIDVDLEPSRSDDSVCTTFSDGCSNRCDCSDYSSEEDDDLDDADSLGTYASQSMPWVVVGAKIGHKLLTARKLRRVIANPDATQKLLPDEAKKLIGTLGDNAPSSPMSLPSATKTQSWEGPSTTPADHDINPCLSDRSVSEIKPPVHGMWTSPGSALVLPPTPNSYGALTLETSPPRGGGKGAAVPAYPTEMNRGPLHGLQAAPPPPSPKLQLQQRGEYFARSPPPLLNNSSTSPTENILLPTMVTPQQSNQSRKMFTFNKVGRGPPPVPVPVTRLAPIEKGVKIVIPMFPPNCRTNASITSGSGFYQMGTVISSHRIYIPANEATKWKRKRKTNCLSIKVILDKALLRASEFVETHLRIMDEWNNVPRHSKFPIGSCVATTFGVGVLVGWRVEDDMHIIRSLWCRSSQGSGYAYLRRDSLHSVVEAAVGFDVQTTYGSGKVMAYVKGGKTNTKGKYIVRLNGRHRGPVMEFNRGQILSCQGATFVPVTEHIRASALYRLEVIHYKSKLREQMLNGPSKGVRDKGMWRNFSEYVDLFANSFSKAIAEDPDFDQEVDKFVSHIVSLLDEKSGIETGKAPVDSKQTKKNIGLCPTSSCETNDAEGTVGWNINDMFSCFFVDPMGASVDMTEDNEDVLIHAQAFDEAHESAAILIRVLLRTITVARASVPDRPKLHMSLAAMHEVLLFVRQILYCQKKHTSRKLIEAWFRALNEISTTFGPLKQRTTALGIQISKKFRKHGNIAKRRILRFVDIILGDTQLLHALELGDWKKSFYRLESAIVQANITDRATCEQLHKGLMMMYRNLAPRKRDRKSKAAAARNGQKIANFAKVIKVIATPGRSIIRLLTRDDVLAVFDRVLVRVFEKDPHCSMVINIYAWNFESLRHLRTLSNMSIAGKLWETVLDAIDEELTFATSEIPEQAKYFIEPFVKLFSLGVAQFHSIQRGTSTADWLEFLMHDDAVNIIQELDYKLIESLEALCNDIKQVVQVLPYIKTIDNDILNLMDEFNLDLFLKEITDVIGDSEKSKTYITERSTHLVERFLDYLPRMSVPIERRELQDGWVLTCRSKDGGDLRLSDLSVLRDNLLLSVLGSENVFQSSNGKGSYIGSPRHGHKSPITVDSDLSDVEEIEESVLDEVKELISSAQSHGSWTAGIGGLKEAYHYKGVPQALTGLPLSDKLKTQVDLWQTSAISDFELLETAIREVSYQIQLQKEREEKEIERPPQNSKRFNPRIDPTVLYLDIKNLTLRLEDFGFRVEKGKPVTIFDPVFEGSGSITVSNVSITLKVEIKKERVFRGGLETPRPVLQLAKFEVGLEKLKLEFMETGADWILNAVLKGFSSKITEIVEVNLKEQIVKQVHTLLEQVNSFIDTNPDLLLNALGISMVDIEESIVCV